jgi:thioesterase domain-containing protein
MFRLTASTISLLSAAAAAGLIQTDTQTQTLVVLDSWATIETHSHMFRYLEENLGHNLAYQMADSKLKLKEFDNWNYDNIIMMAPSIKGTIILSCNFGFRKHN